MSNFEYTIGGGKSGVEFCVVDWNGKSALKIDPWAEYEGYSWNSTAPELRELIEKLQEALEILEGGFS
jgi:hypothetical protein